MRDLVLKSFPTVDTVAYDVVEALVSLLDPNLNESQYKKALFGELSVAIARANHAAMRANGPWDPEVKIDFVLESCLATVNFADGGGKPYEKTALYEAWSSAHSSARLRKVFRKRSPTPVIVSGWASAIDSPTDAAAPAEDGLRLVDAVGRALEETGAPAAKAVSITSSTIGPICPDVVCQVSIKGPGPGEAHVARTGVIEVKAPRLQPGVDEAKASANMHRHSLAQAIAYCQVNRQMGGLGLGMAICGSSFSRVWAVTDTIVAVEVCRGIRPVGADELWTVRRLFPRRVLRPLLAYSFLDGSTWAREKTPRPEELNMKAVEIFHDYLRCCVELTTHVMGPGGPRAMPAVLDPPIIDLDGIKVDASSAADTFRLSEILRGACSATTTPGATPSPAASGVRQADSDLSPSDSASNSGLGDISEELIDELDEQLGVLLVEKGETTQQAWMRQVTARLASGSDARGSGRRE